MNTPTLYLIDLDNIVGGPWNDDLVDASLEELLCVSDYSDGDHVVVAAEAVLARTAFFSIPVPSRKLVGRGPDGADNALAEFVPADHIVDRYSRLVVASGDGRFADLVGQVQRVRSMAEVYGRPSSIARSLESVAKCIELRPLAEVIRRCRDEAPSAADRSTGDDLPSVLDDAHDAAGDPAGLVGVG